LIFCTLGTHPQPFDRALDWLIPAAAGRELVVQYSATRPRPRTPNSRWYPFLEYQELTELMAEADVVVSHGGVGSLMTAIGLGVVPIAIPRLSAEGEHIDDHQREIADELGRAGYVIPCEERATLESILATSAGAVPSPPAGSGPLRRVAILAAGGIPAD
jgi:UDP-N-acetylglucosamine transferase subunit ALG13